jgi:DNA (cytosine-5)-methyltransferase 1
MKVLMKKQSTKMPANNQLSNFTVNADNVEEVLAGITKRERAPKLLVVDLFCGAGGTSTGFEMTDGEAIVIACVNHDFMAIKSHWRNYPHIAHFEEDIRTLNLAPLVRLLNHYRRLYPNAKVVVWASLECTNFSKAKGGQPRDADSRTLADHLDRYILALNPDYLQIENVVEFMSWGPLDENGKPVSRKNGCDFMRWCNYIDSLGYYNEWREMNSADFGAYTSRNRLFGCFAKHGLPIVWPKPTHGKVKKSKKAAAQPTFFDMQELKPWKAVRHVLDLQDEGMSIFDRKKPLSDRTLDRIYAGLVKFVAGGKDAFMLKYNSTSAKGVHHPPSIDEPCPVIATQNRLGVAFITKYFSGRPEGKVISVDEPAGTLTTVDHQAVVSTTFIQKYHGNGDNLHSIEAPCPTLATKDQCAVVSPCFIMSDFTTGDNTSSIDQPMGSLLPVPKRNIVTAEPFVMNTNYSNGPTSLQEPMPTITANRKWQYIVNPSHGGNSSSIDAPCPVLIARQDKSPLYLMVSECGSIAIHVNEGDSEAMIKIKEFMLLYNISDIKMRMLKVSEMLQIQGFTPGYILEGSQEKQKKFIGNSVVPIVVASWIKSFIDNINNSYDKHTN